MRYQSPEKYLAAIKGLYIHCFICVIGSTFMIVLNVLTSSMCWAIFPVVGWGFGLALHMGIVHGLPRLFSPEWEARIMRKWQARQQ